jgi:hypothetical protein
MKSICTVFCNLRWLNFVVSFVAIMLLGTQFSTFGQNTNYPSTAEPLESSAFVRLPLGSINPRGWLATQLELQKEGLTGHSEEIYSELGRNSAWLGGDEPHSDWERPPYYLKGLVSLAYSLDDADLKSKAQKWIDWALDSQSPDGNFGPTTNDDWWPRMPLITALMDYCEATDDSRVITFLTNYFQYQANTLPSRPLRDWGKARAADNVEVIIWLYNRTGDDFLLSLIDLIHNQAYNYSDIFINNTFLSDFHNDFYPKHGVNVAQAYKFGPIFYQRTKDATDKEAFSTGITNLDPYHTHITRLNSCTEFLSGNGSIQGVELCGIVERMYSNEIASRILGEAWIGDELEKIAFNQLPGAFSEDIHQHQYYTLPNQVQSKEGGNGFGQDYGNAEMPGPYSGFACCRFNLHMGWPKYVQHAWMATNDNGLAATAYGPSVVTALVADGKEVSIEEETNYPFEEQIRFNISTAQAVNFPLTLRIPEWCDAPEVRVNGVSQSGVTAGQYFTIDRTWSDGDVVVLDVPMEVETSQWVNNSVGVERGPLIFSLQMDENWVERNNYTFAGKDFSEYEIFPQNDWNYGLVVNPDQPETSITVEQGVMPENPFSPAATPIKLKAKARKIPSWGLTVNGVHAAEPPLSPVESDQPEEEVTLIPFGAEHIRVTYFPLIGTPVAAPNMFVDTFQTNAPNKWVNFGGGWQQKDGKYYSESYNVKGIKSVATKTDFSDLTLDATITILNDDTEGGVLFRVSEPAMGADSYKGYYAGIKTSGEVILGKANNDWAQIGGEPLNIDKSKAYHLRVVAEGNRIKVFVDDMHTPKIDVTDNSFTSGSIGLRQYSGPNTPDPSGQTVIFERVTAVDKDDPVISWSDPDDITEGTELGNDQLNASADIDGTFTYTPAAGTLLPVGENLPVRADFVPEDTLYYNNASDVVYINVLSATNVNLIPDLESKFFPNPVKTVLHFKDIPKGAKLNVIDINGKLIRHKKNTDDQLYVGDLKSGIYFLEIISNHKRGSAKFIIESTLN